MPFARCFLIKKALHNPKLRLNTEISNMNKTTRETTSFSEYVNSMKDAGSIFQWLWKETTTAESRKYLYKMLAWLSVAIVFQTFVPAAVSYVFQGLVNSDKTMVEFALVAFLAFSLMIKYLENKQENAREHSIGMVLRSLEDKVTSLFLGKSLAQHAHEGRRLSASSIDKGKWKMFDMQIQVLFQGIPLLIQWFVALVALLIMDWVSCLLMLALVAFSMGMSLFLNYRVAKVCTPIEQDFKALGRVRFERMEHNSRVKTCGHEYQETSEMSDSLKEILERDRAFWLWFISRSALRGAVNVFVLTAVMAWGAWQVWSGHWGIGLLYPLYAWASRVSENMTKLAELERHLSKNITPVKIALEALAIPPAIVDKPNAIILDHTVPHRIEFKHVSHKYPASVEVTGDMPHTLLDVSLVIEPGEKVAVMGESGAGKTTLMKKLLRFGDPTSGSILVGGNDLRDISLSSYMRGVGYAAQQAEAFDGTIKENLLYGLTSAERKLVTDERLLEITRLLKVDFKSLDTIVGTRGLKLSGGQAQRLLLAAAVVKNPWLLVIDEGTASLDSSTEKAVQEGLAAALSGDISALIITHRLNTVRNLCDKFVVLKPAAEVKPGENQVEAIAGSFEELYMISPTFRRLADDQGVVVKLAA